MDGGGSLVVLVEAALRLFFSGSLLRGTWARGLFCLSLDILQVEPAMRPVLHDLVVLTEILHVPNSLWYQ